MDNSQQITPFSEGQKALLAYWISLSAYALLFSPRAADELRFAFEVMTFQDAGRNIVLFSVLCLMMLWPFILAPLLLFTNDYQLRPWPFWLLSFGLGFFALAPYVALRRKKLTVAPQHRPRWWQWWRHKMLTGVYAAATAALSLSLLTFMVVYKDLPAYMDLFFHYGFVHVMTLDCLSLHGLALWLIYQDPGDIPQGSSPITTVPLAAMPRFTKLAVLLLPVFGPAIYPILRHRYMNKLVRNTTPS